MTNTLEKLFREFLAFEVKHSNDNVNDLEYCLLQSTVEPIIRFKFGAWIASKGNSNDVFLNLMETNRIDLLLGIGEYLYVIEFGHLLNLLKHKARLNNDKIKFDNEKIKPKIQTLLNKIKHDHISHDLLKDKKIVYVNCSLFSDFKLEKNMNGERTVSTKIKTPRLKAGTFFKYNNSFNENNYFDHYANFINTKPKEIQSDYLQGYTEFKVIEGELSLHYKFELSKQSIEVVSDVW